MKLNARSILEKLSEAQSRRLHRYAALLRDRALPLGMVSRSDRDRLWERHIVDSLRGAACMGIAKTAIDIGSGAGLPGIPLAIARPEVGIVLVEPKTRRGAFLESVVQELSLGNVEVVIRPAEELGRRSDLCLARAVAPPTGSWRLAAQVLSDAGRLLYWAGRTWGDDQVAQLKRLGVEAKTCREPQFQWQGPLVIMNRFSTLPSRTDE